MTDTDRQIDRREPRRVEATAEDVSAPKFLYIGGKQIGLITDEWDGGARFIPTEEPHVVAPDVSRLGNLRTPEADAPDIADCAPPWSREALRSNIEQVKDPTLRRALLEEFHRNT